METIQGMVEVAKAIKENGDPKLNKKLDQIIEDLEDKPRKAIRGVLKASNIAKIIEQESA